MAKTISYPSSTESCPSCGAPVAGGREACQALFDEFTTQAYEDFRLGAVRDLAFDAYCMQHLETYCRSAKSYAAHLTRLCCGLEYGGDPAVYAAIQKWLNGAVVIEKPAILARLGHLTIWDVSTATTPEMKVTRAKDWAACVWEAYASQQELAHNWIRKLI